MPCIVLLLRIILSQDGPVSAAGSVHASLPKFKGSISESGKCSFIDHEIFSMVIFSVPLIKVEHLSVTVGGPWLH